MTMQSKFKLKIMALLAGGVLISGLTGSYQPAHADEGWGSLLQPLINSVILPAIDTKIDKIGARLDQKAMKKAAGNATTYTNTTTPADTSTVTTPTTTIDGNTNPYPGIEYRLPEEPGS